MNLNEIYTELIAEHNNNKRNKREMEKYDTKVKGNNPNCGDEISLKVKFKGEILEDISYQGVGCAISQASTSIMIDLVKGKTKKEAERTVSIFLNMIKKEEQDEEELQDILEDAYAFKNISNMPSRVKCAVLSWHTLLESLKK